MDVKDLRYFVAAYEARSFSRATVVLGTVQSNVSLRIRNLEESLEVTLFERHHRSVVPTEDGEILYRYATKVIEALDQAKLAFKPTRVA